MADNTTLNPGASGDVIATDDIGGVKHQQVKLEFGENGTATPVSATDPLPVEITNDVTLGGTVELGATTLTALETTELGATSLAALENISAAVTGSIPAGTNNIGDVDIASALPAGDNNIGNVDVVSLPALAAGTNNIGDVDVLTLPALPAGTNNIGDVDVLSIVPGTGATNLGKAEDAAHASGDVGVMALAVRQNSQSDLGADGDYVPLTVDDSGGVRVSIVAGAGSGGTAAADDADFTAGTTQGTPIMGVYESTPTSITDGDLGAVGITANRELKVSVSAGGVSGRAEDSAHSTGQEGVVLLAVRRDSASSGVDTDGDYATLSVTSNGSLRVSGDGGSGGTQYAVDTAGGGTDTGTLALAVRDDALGTLTPADGDYTQLRTNARGAQWVAMDAEAHDAALSSNPILVGGYASAAAPTNVSGDGDAVRAWMLRNGAQCVQLTAAGALIAGDATNGIDVDVTRLPTLAAVTTVSTVTTVGTVTNITNQGHGADDAAFTPATTRVMVGGYFADDVTTDSVDEGDMGAARMTLNRRQITQPYESEANTWVYAAAAGGLVSTTGVTAKAAAGAGIRNYVTGVQVTNSHQSTGTEILIRDGASGTVLHRGWAPPNGGYTTNFVTPLRGTANTLVEIAETVATATAGVLVNLQGYVSP